MRRTRTRTRRAASVLLMGCVLGSGLAPPLGAHEEHAEFEHLTPLVATTTTPGTPTTAATNSIGCPSRVSCGFRCTATLGSGFCVTLVNGKTKNTFGPKLTLTCKVCDCMYIAPGPNGQVLLRKVDLGCEGGFEGLELY